MEQESQFEIVGYFEELYNASTREFLGTRRVPKDAARTPGHSGEKSFTLTTNLEITRGHKTAVVKASTAKPVEILTRYYPLCGRLKRNIL